MYALAVKNVQEEIAKTTRTLTQPLYNFHGEMVNKHSHAKRIFHRYTRLSTDTRVSLSTGCNQRHSWVAFQSCRDARTRTRSIDRARWYTRDSRRVHTTTTRVLFAQRDRTQEWTQRGTNTAGVANEIVETRENNKPY